MSEADAYASSRAGARASRGFGYQHAVGAWVCAKVATGDLHAADVIPEGLEDTQTTGADPAFIQAKSRQATRGDFSVAEVLGFLRRMIEIRGNQPRNPASERLVLVLEREVDGAPSLQWNQSLADLPPTNPIRLGAEDLLSPLADGQSSLSTLLTRTAVVVFSWDQLNEETRAALSVASGLPLGAVGPLVHMLREEVSQCTAQNASSNLACRRTLSRQSIQRLITETALLVDIESLTTALSTGRCIPVDFDTPIDDPRFFEGIDVRPGHVVAGLPAPRTALVDFASDALRSQHAALLTGPSGVGKSTVMWSTAYAMRDVLWYEVARLERGDDEDVWRLLLALGPKPASPIGLVVDSVGTKDPSVWDALRNRLPVDGSVLLLGSIRTEDLSILATAGKSAIVECRMDKAVARELFEGLQAQGRTTLTVWEDAYEASNNLTMEYTYMLTQGQRLSSVLGEQVRRREHEHRSIELEVLRLVSTAARWGARVPADALAKLAPDVASRREALRRLIGEHLIVLDGSHYVGVHQLRASILSSILHETPPPTLESTTVELVHVVDPPDLRALVLEFLFEQPESAPVVIEALGERMGSGGDCALLILVLRALRAADFRRDGRAWAQILDAHAVPQAYRSITVWLALTESDMQEDALKHGIGASIRQMKAAPQKPLWRDAFLGELGPQNVRNLTSAANSLDEVEGLLGALQGATSVSELARLIARLPSVIAFVADARPEAASSFIGLLGSLDPEAARGLRETLGSDQWARRILFSLNPWIVRTSARSGDEQEFGLDAELLYGGDWFGIDPHQQAVEAARTLLNLYPECTVNVRTIDAAGELLAYGDHQFGQSQLLRKYNLHPEAIDWNRERARLILQLAMRRSDAERAEAVASLMGEVDRFFSELTSAWAHQSVSRRSIREFAEVQQRLIAANDALPGHSVPEVVPEDESSAGASNVLDTDDLHSLVDGICSNIATRLLEKHDYNSLAAFVGDTMLTLVPKARLSENWRVSPDADPLVALENIERTLHNLHAVLAEIAYGREPKAVVLSVASAGGRASALARCAERAVLRASDRLGKHLDQIVTSAAACGVAVRWVSRDAHAPSASTWPPIEVALIVELQSVNEWDAAASALHALVVGNGESMDLGHPILVPAIQDRAVLPLVMRCGSVLYPAAEAAAEWGTVLGTPIPTPTADGLQRLWVVLQAMSSLTLRARLRDEPHALNDMPVDLVTRLATEVDGLTARLKGSPLDTEWQAWRVETVGSVVSQAGQRDLNPNDVWVARATAGGASLAEPLELYLLFWAAVLDYDLQCGLGDRVS